MQTDQTTAPAAEQHEALARRWFDAMSRGDHYAAADETFAPDYTVFMGADEMRGTAAIKALVDQYRAAFPDLRFTVDDVIAEGDRLAVRWTATGRNDGPLLGMPASGRRATWAGVSCWQMADGRCIEDRVTMDALGMMQQLGAVPA
ncbi:MAG TPA: ester cyclase [Rubricoccaceae bacterium]|nr:ester cyclase [Rubricoccaceae bacterium]